MLAQKHPLKVKELYRLMDGSEDKAAAITADAWSLKRFITLLIRRWKEAEKMANQKGCTPRFRVPRLHLSDYPI